MNQQENRNKMRLKYAKQIKIKIKILLRQQQQQNINLVITSINVSSVTFFIQQQSLKMPIFMILLISLIICYSSADTLNIDQPSIITWQKNNSIAALIIRSINITNVVILQKLESLPSQIVQDSQSETVNAVSNNYVTIYESGDVFHAATIDYYYKSYNGNSQISNLSSTSTQSTITLLSAQPILNDFAISPKISSSSVQFPNSSYVMANDQNVYVLANGIYSDLPKCGTLSKLNPQMAKNQDCQYLSPQNIIKYNMFTFSTVNVITQTNSEKSSLPYPSPKNMPITLTISQNILGTNLNVQPLSQQKVNLSQISVNVKTQKIGTSYSVIATVTNNGITLSFIALQATQGSQKIYDQFVVLQQNSQVVLTFAMSKSSPFDDVVFNITNPLTSQYYTFNKPTSIIQDSSQTSYRLTGTTFTPYSSISVGVLAAIICGGAALIIISFGVFIYRRKKLQEKVKLNLERLKSSVSTAAPTYPSQRQFIKDQFSVPSRVNVGLAKEKPQTSTTLASQNMTSSQQYEPNEQKVPSLQDKLQIRDPLDDLQIKMPRAYKPAKKHKRTASTLPILPPLCESAQHADPYSQKNEQNLDRISV